MKKIENIVNLSQDSLEDELGVFVDWREEEEVIVNYFSEKLVDNDVLEPIWKNDDLVVKYNNVEYKIPLTMSTKDRDVVISSIGYLLRDNYEIRILKSTLGSDTLGFVILTHEQWNEVDTKHRTWSKKHFEKYKPGRGYFCGGRVPYTNNKAVSKEKPWWKFW